MSQVGLNQEVKDRILFEWALVTNLVNHVGEGVENAIAPKFGQIPHSEE